MKPKMSDLNLRDESQDRSGDGSMRLQVYISHAGIASRRAAEGIIAEGRVSVNGEIVTAMGVRVSSSDDIRIDGKPIKAESRKLYILLNKPVGHVCTLADEQGRPVAADLLKDAYPERLYNIGRLDMYSGGAIVFTNDGDFAAAVSHPSSGIEKEYLVETSLPFRDDVLTAFTRGVRIDSEFYRCREAARVSSRRIRIVLVEGKNREIRRVLKYFGIGIKSLIRTRVGPVELGDLEVGAFRELSSGEIRGLLDARSNNGDGDDGSD